jgi:uncharacterized protein (DUF433 family)
MIGDGRSVEQRIVRDPGISCGEAIFRGTRVTLRTVLASLAEGDTPETILSDFPSLSAEDLQAEALTPNRVTTFGQIVPLITPELFLFAVTRTTDVGLGQQLAASGLHVDALELVGTADLASPEKLMF